MYKGARDDEGWVKCRPLEDGQQLAVKGWGKGGEGKKRKKMRSSSAVPFSFFVFFQRAVRTCLAELQLQDRGHRWTGCRHLFFTFSKEEARGGKKQKQNRMRALRKEGREGG